MRSIGKDRAGRSRDTTRLRAALLLCMGLALVGAAPDPVELPPDPLPLAWCLERARLANPSLDVARAAAEAALARVYPAGALPDPQFRYELSNVPTGELDLESTPLSGQQLGLSQRFPFPGVLGNRRAAARSAAFASREELGAERWRIDAAVEDAWVELGFAQRALEVTQENIALLRQLAKIAEARYEVGEGLQQDVIRAQVALTELLDERLQRVAEVRGAEAHLAALLDAPPETQFPATAALAETAPVPELAPLLLGIEETSPQLEALGERIEEAVHRRRVATLEGYPDFDLGLGYRIRREVAGDPVEGDDFIGASVGIRLPVDRRKWRWQVAEAGALLRRAEAEFRRIRAELREILRTRHAQLVRADREIALLESGLIPQARQSLASTRSAYQVDKVDFLDVIDSQVRLLNAELRLVRAIADRREAFAAVEAASGRALR